MFPQNNEDFLDAAKSFERLFSDYIPNYIANPDPIMTPNTAQQKNMVLRIFKRKNAVDEYWKKMSQLTYMHSGKK